MPKGQPFSPEVKAKSIARVQELVKTGAAPSTWSALVQVARDLKCSPETVRVWLSKPLTPPARRGRPPKRIAAAAAAAQPPASPSVITAILPTTPRVDVAALGVARMLLANAMDILKQLEAAR